MATTIIDILLPSMGEGVTEATVIGWLVKAGDKVSADDPILEVSTDKVDTEVPAPYEGVIKETIANKDDVMKVGNVLARIEVDESVAKQAAAAPAPTQAAKPAAIQQRTFTGGSAAGSSTTKSSPLVRKIAMDQQINLSQVDGTGSQGRITKHDLGKYLHLKSQMSSPRLFKFETEKRGDDEFLEGVPVRREPMNKMRKLIAEHMVQSVTTSPHVTTVFEIDLSSVVASRQKYKAEFQEKNGFKLTYTHYFVHATKEAIKQHPIVNSSVDGYDILHKEDINLGVAVAIESGLIVPVIKRTNDMSLLEVSTAMNDLVIRARSKKLKPDDVVGGTFSITNPGGYGSYTSNPIINQPQVAILGIGAIYQKVFLEGDKPVSKPMILMSLTFDHRVIDGEGGAKYLATLRSLLEGYEQSPLG